MLIGAEPLRRLVADIFDRVGCSPAESKRIAHYLVSANLTGHDSHGVIRVPRYVQMVRDGKVHPNRSIRVVSDGEAMAVVDGQYGFGQSVAPEAVRLGIDKAARSGVAIVALRHAGHIGRVGNWAEMAAEAGQVSVHFVNAAGSILVAPFGGTDRRFSTAPFCAGVPQQDGPPLILDFATSVVAEGKVLVAAKGGKPVPATALITGDGILTDDPVALYGTAGPDAAPDARNGTGAIRAMGDHKGSGLALICELLGGALTGGGCAGPGEKPFSNGMLSIYMTVAAFDDRAGFAAEVARYVDFVKAANPATPGGEVVLPGEPERRMTALREAEGIPLADAAWATILATAEGVGIGRSRIDALLA